MSRYFYDLHVHSCLSPCGDDDMTPANIAGMASIKGLGIVALTDHNTTKNCPAFFKACKVHGIIPVAGMELTTLEDVHLVCLFPDLESAMEFNREVEIRRSPIKNRPELFGRQQIMDHEDNVIEEEENLLLYATELSLDEGKELCESLGGAAYPAHIDRESNGIVAILGGVPEDADYYAYELNQKEASEEYIARFPHLSNMKQLVSSDAHYLWDISEAVNSLEIHDEPYSSDLVRRNLIALIKGGASQ